MRIQPFQAWRPVAAAAAEVASVPYDVVDRAEAARQVLGKPLSFLHVTRAEIDLSESISPYAEQVYAKALSNFEALRKQGTLVQESARAFFVYRQEWQGHVQHGIVACCRTEDYSAGLIKRHEKTRADKEDDRTRHILALRAHTGLVLMAYSDLPAVNALVQVAEAHAPLYDFAAEDGIRHAVWRLRESQRLMEAFEKAPAVYIADGHHRAAAAARVAEQLRAEVPARAGQEEYNSFPAVLFPASQLKILPYNRCVSDLNGLSEGAFLKAVGRQFALKAEVPAGPKQIAMFLGGRWFGLSWAPDPKADAIAALDVSVLQDRLLSPILGIADPRTDKRLEFIGGIRGTVELEERVRSGRAAVAFSLFPVTVEQLMAVADQGQCLPPKSTWFEPKLRDGLLVHTF